MHTLPTIHWVSSLEAVDQVTWLPLKPQKDLTTLFHINSGDPQDKTHTLTIIWYTLLIKTVLLLVKTPCSTFKVLWDSEIWSWRPSLKSWFMSWNAYRMPKYCTAAWIKTGFLQLCKVVKVETISSFRNVANKVHCIAGTVEPDSSFFLKTRW